jgi:Ca-activated chloride channel homolog
VTALYEIVPAAATDTQESPRLRYQRVPQEQLAPAAHSGELLTIRLRYKRADAEKSTETEVPILNHRKPFDEASADSRFAAAVALFGMHLARSPHTGHATLAQVEAIAAAALGPDPGGFRAEFVDLVRRAAQVGH